MSQVAENVRVGGDGVIWVGPNTATAPAAPGFTDGVLAVLATPWMDLGYASEDGVTKATNVSVEAIKAWQRADVVRESTTEAETTYELTLIETRKEVVELYYEDELDADGSLVENPGRQRGSRSFTLDVIDGDKAERIYIPNGVLSGELGDVQYVNGSPVGYPVTIKTRYSSAIGGHAKHWWTELAETVAP